MRIGSLMTAFSMLKSLSVISRSSWSLRSQSLTLVSGRHQAVTLKLPAPLTLSVPLTLSATLAQSVTQRVLTSIMMRVAHSKSRLSHSLLRQRRMHRQRRVRRQRRMHRQRRVRRQRRSKAHQQTKHLGIISQICFVYSGTSVVEEEIVNLSIKSSPLSS